MNHAHTNLPTLFLENYKDYPEQFRYFACAVVKRRSEWASIDTARVHFEKLGHRDYYVDNLLYHIASLHNMLNLWHRGILNRTNFIQSCSEITIHTLDSHQTAIFNQIVQAMNDRNEHYSALYPMTYFHTVTGRKTCYPFVPSYALTMTKSQGQNLAKVLLWFDSPKCAPGCAYMALSRVRKLQDLHILTPIRRSQVIPVTADNMGQT